MDAFAALPTSSMPDELLAELEATGVELLEGPALAPYGQATDEGE